MANPQIEDGHVDLANEIVEALAKIRISGEEMQCLWVIFRKTYGWHKKEDQIALSQFTNMTGLDKPAVCHALKKLLLKNTIVIVKKDNGITTYRFNKDFDSWNPLPKKTMLSKNTKGGVKKHNKSLSKKTHTKETSTKETSTKEILAHFETFYKAYPRKAGRPNAETAFKKINPSKELLDKILHAISIQSQTDQWKKENGQFIPHPATWLNQKRWEDEIKEIQGKNSW